MLNLDDAVDAEANDGTDAIIAIPESYRTIEQAFSGTKYDPLPRLVDQAISALINLRCEEFKNQLVEHDGRVGGLTRGHDRPHQAAPDFRIEFTVSMIAS